jgi:hypothetical protein
MRKLLLVTLVGICASKGGEQYLRDVLAVIGDSTIIGTARNTFPSTVDGGASPGLEQASGSLDTCESLLKGEMRNPDIITSYWQAVFRWASEIGSGNGQLSEVISAGPRMMDRVMCSMPQSHCSISPHGVWDASPERNGVGYASFEDLPPPPLQSLERLLDLSDCLIGARWYAEAFLPFCATRWR